MNDTTNPSNDGDLPAPLRCLSGICQWMLGLVVGALGALLRAFPVTSPLGAPILKIAYKLSYNGGRDTMQGLIGTFTMTWRGLSSGVRSTMGFVSNQTAKRRLPPAE